MSRQSDVFALQPVVIVVGTSDLVGISGGALCVSQLVKYGSGGSLQVHGHSTFADGGYLMGTGEALTIGGPSTFYLKATGVTTTAYYLRFKDGITTTI